MGLKESLIRPKPVCILLKLKDTSKDWYASNLALACGSTYVHTAKLLKEYRKANLVTTEVKGRLKKVKLTEKGTLLAGALNDLMPKLEEKEEEKKTA